MLFVSLLPGSASTGFGKLESQLSGVLVIFDAEEDFLVFILCSDVAVEGGIALPVKWCHA